MNTDEPIPTEAAPATGADRTPVDHYEIRVAGRLSPRWATWFDGLALAEPGDGTTTLRGPVVDQAALHGLLQRLRDLGLTLLSLTRIPPDDASEPPISPTNHRTTAPGATP